MGKKLLDEDGLVELWRKIKRRSIPVKALSQNEYDELSQEEKEKEVLYIVDDHLLFLGEEISGSSTHVQTAKDISFDNEETSLEAENVQEAIDLLFTSVSNGKKLLSSAITDKGIPTDPDDSFEGMSNNISKISSPPSDLYTLSLIASPSNGGSATGGGQLTSGCLATVRATSNSNWAFEGWKNDGTIVSRDNTYIFRINGDTSLTASFVTNPTYQIGVTWVQVNLPTSFKRIVYGNGVFVALPYSASSNATGRTYVSMDGLSWTSSDQSLGLVNTLMDITFGNGRFVIRTSTGVYYGSDGFNWESIRFVASSSYDRIIYGGNLFILYASRSSGSTLQNYPIMYSSDGLEWANGTIPTNALSIILTSMTYGNGYYVATTTTSSMLYSSNGKSWTLRTGVFSGSGMDDIAYGAGKFVAVSYQHNNSLQYSNTAIPASCSFSNVSSLSAQRYKAICYGERFVANPMSNSSYPSKNIYSTNGTTWLDGADYLYGADQICYGGGVYIGIREGVYYCMISYTSAT